MAKAKKSKNSKSDKLTGMRFSPGWAKSWRLRGRAPAAPAE